MDVKHVKVWGAPVPVILDLKLQLRFLDGAVTHYTGRTDAGSSPQPVRWAIRELALLDSLAGLVVLVWPSGPPGDLGGTVKPKCREQ